MTIELPASCKLGMTSANLASVFSEEELEDLHHWMRGQTGAICEGVEWDYATEDYIESGCGPHGYIVYTGDVERFVLGLPVID